MAKIAILSFYSGITERGVETFVFEIAKRLQMKHDVTIFQAGSSKFEFTAKTRKHQLKIRHISTPASSPISQKGILAKLYLDWQSLKILVFSLKVLPAIFRDKYDLIIPVNGGWQVALFRLASKIGSFKMIISGHAGLGWDDAFNLFFRPDTFVALTSAQAIWAQKLTPEVKIITIPNGVDLSRFNPQATPVDIFLEKPVVICASALVPYKRVDLTIKAVAKSKSLSLLVLGDGQLRGYIDGLGKRMLGKRYLRIVVPYEQMPSYYRSGSVFTLASETEAFGISYIEAMACNLPVVTTNDTSRQEIIGEAGMLTDPTNINQYAKDLVIAANTNYRNRPYDQSLKFSWNKIAQKYALLIKQLLSS